MVLSNSPQVFWPGRSMLVMAIVNDSDCIDQDSMSHSSEPDGDDVEEVQGKFSIVASREEEVHAIQAPERMIC